MAERITGPFFKWFGSKWLASRLYPAPRFDDIIEPFAGSAGYSLRHHSKRVWLFDTDPSVRDLWIWLIDHATPGSVLEIPLGTPPATDIRGLGLDYGQALLLKMWQRTNNVGQCWTTSPWGHLPGQWTESTRARVAAQLPLIKHWRFVSDHRELPRICTWFVDPPYEGNYQYGKRPIDYGALAAEMREICAAGNQVIVCEARNPKTGAAPTWLPFEDFASRITSRRKSGNHHHSQEMIWDG